MNEKEIRREIRICNLAGKTSMIGAFLPIAGAIILVVAAELPGRNLDFSAGMLVLTLSCLFLLMALGLAMCGALFFIHRRQEEQSLHLLQLLRAGMSGKSPEGTTSL